MTIPQWVQLETYVGKAEKCTLVESKAADSPDQAATKLALQARVKVAVRAAAVSSCTRPPAACALAKPISLPVR